MDKRDYPHICGNCKWWGEPNDDLTNGYCQRYPLALPKVFREWCGEFAIMRKPRYQMEDGEIVEVEWREDEEKD